MMASGRDICRTGEDILDFEESLASDDLTLMDVPAATQVKPEGLSEAQFNKLVERLLAQFGGGKPDDECLSTNVSGGSGDILDSFDSNNRNSCVDRCLSKIDQLGQVINGWSSYERSLHMQVELRGEELE